MTENPQTEVSMLAPHRVKPYHFKGFNQDQKDQVNFERSQQMKEAEMMKKQAVDEDKAYAMQQEAIRRQQIIADRKHKRQNREVTNEHYKIQHTQAGDFKEKWHNPYHLKAEEPTHPGNVKL